MTIKSDILLETLEALKKKGLTTVRNKLLLALPERFFKEGSDLWWEREELLADEDIKYGRVSKGYDNAEELIAALKRGKMEYDRSFRREV